MATNEQLMKDYRTVERAIHWLESHAQDHPTLGMLALELGLSPAHVQRVFKRWAGVSPKQFLEFLTVRHAKSLLASSASVLETSMDVGLSGPGRLHDHMVQVDAVSPGEYKSGERGITIHYGWHPSPFGACLLGVTDRGVCYLAFSDETGDVALEEDLRRRWPGAECIASPRRTKSVCVDAFHPLGQTPLRLFLRGTNFQLKVWEALLRIPPGAVTSYGILADRIGHPAANRAVGTAVGANPVAYLIPCHRVLQASGAFHHYRWGPQRKKAMLVREAFVSGLG